MEKDLPIAGRRIARVSVSYVSPYLVLDLPGWATEDSEADHDYVLQIDGPLCFVSPDQESVVDLEDGPSTLTLHLLGKSIARAGASEDGALRVEFADGEVLVIEPGVYEPWQLSADDGTSVISVAGGGLAEWRPR